MAWASYEVMPAVSKLNFDISAAKHIKYMNVGIQLFMSCPSCPTESLLCVSLLCLVFPIIHFYVFIRCLLQFMGVISKFTFTRKPFLFYIFLGDVF